MRGASEYVRLPSTSINARLVVVLAVPVVPELSTNRPKPTAKLSGNPANEPPIRSPVVRSVNSGSRSVPEKKLPLAEVPRRRAANERLACRSRSKIPNRPDAVRSPFCSVRPDVVIVSLNRDKLS